MTYVVTGWTLLNDMNFADGRRAEGSLGGAIFVVAGIKPFCDDVLIVSTAGPDFDDTFGLWYRRNGLSTAGMKIMLPRTSYNILDYHPDGRWWEYSKYGGDFEREWLPRALIQTSYVVEQASPETRGIYFESASRESVWQGLDEIRKAAPNAKIMWEIPTTEIDDPTARDSIARLIERVDIYSLNLPESKSYFGTTSEEESVKAILALGKPCFFRVGEKGAYMIQDGRDWFAQSVGVEQSVDATGCGNCSTGTAMYGFCEGFHPLRTVILANLAASLNAMQFGPYPLFTPELRAELLQEAEAEYRRLGGE